MTQYRAPIRDMLFTMREVGGLSEIAALPGNEEVTDDLIEAIFEEAGKFAADVLSPLSPVPGRLAAVCAGMRVSGHGITAPPAHELPEPWLSLLAFYQRRKPDAPPVPDGYAAVTAALPELDGIRLALLGLLNADGSSWIQLLVRGLVPERRTGPFGIDYFFPLSFWIRDNVGRWHAGRPAGVRQSHGEWAVKLEMVPPLARSTTSIEVLAAGASGQVRVRLPLRWGYSQ